MSKCNMVFLTFLQNSKLKKSYKPKKSNTLVNLIVNISLAKVLLFDICLQMSKKM